MFQRIEQVEAFFSSRANLGIKPGLFRMKKLLKEVGNPQDKIKAIHVAGTNGKGSTIQFIQRALTANGYNVGIFTSPSIYGLPGHILDGDVPIKEQVFLSLFNRLYPAIEILDNKKEMPTEFEILTVIAFMHFHDSKEIAIIETGMGGREDTTNCFLPILSIITNIAKDHTHFLGGTIKEIAYHKAGIIKKDIPAIIGEVPKEAEMVLNQEAKNVQTGVYQLGKDFHYHNIIIDGNHQFFSWNRERQQYNLSIQMQGKHQVQNASLAFMSIYLLKQMNYSIDMNKTMEAFKISKLPGRFEMVNIHPPVILDGAHNIAGIETFIDTVKALYPNKTKHLIFAAFKDKDFSLMLERLETNFSSVTLTSFEHPRAAKAVELYEVTNHKHKFLTENWEDAIKKITYREHIYFITGSLHFISRVREFFRNRES
ncbi:folylpolyglutamate synthase/dihydrofolate synthase family protein [Virgibacillus sp. SK37]|uniref:bifunctional folylpolyglutamate synthase/dihydrofolate synthase n=1 Tax=Virgibacillus sp. SK37 TaxID=403957 RepID=UPI0004D12411|nr:Mur ligase family protein [Virgibacillus sp. SK37]AIF43300.1 folylpolyglutamate synthase [Virgibacillus sp. SK37]